MKNTEQTRKAEQARIAELMKPFDPPAHVIPPTPKPRRFYSKKTAGFYSDDIHGKNMPADAVEISESEWLSLLQAQNQGKEIVAGTDGKPIAADPVITPFLKRQSIEGQIMALSMAPDTLTAMRGTLLGKPGAKEQLAAIDSKIEALRATIPPQ